MRKVDYSKLMYDELEVIKGSGKRPTLLLHLCCAPCSSYVIELLNSYFDLSLYFYDPNIHPQEEYIRRRDEAQSYAEAENIVFYEGPYDVERWHELTKDNKADPEKGGRCSICYDMRLEAAARFACSLECEYFTTVLSVSPHKDAGRINETGLRLSEGLGIRYLPADFKKKEGFKKTVEMGKASGFYRQDYCGCVYSKR
ncbi:MAG: epoxyqueuosine reductase QueH [bacterium]|nr:epoxyqueuosine reductase QueH [bacterium]